MKTIKHTMICFVLVLAFIGNARATSISNIPSIMSAPVVLYDEANNALTDGEYTVIITLTDFIGTTLYAEEHNIIIEKGVAYITVGQGYAVGSGQSSPAGGLSWDIFANQGDVSVEIQVEGQANAQEITVLGSQPYSFIAQRALSVDDDSITSDKIMDGTITEEDLDEGLVDKILASSGSGSSTTSSSSNMVNAKDVSVSSSIGLNNASGDNVYDVLRGLDTSIDLLRETHLDQSISTVETSVTNISNTINNLDKTYATDAQLSSSVSTLNSRISQNTTDIGTLEDQLAQIDDVVDVEDVPIMIRPVAYGYMESSNKCDNMTLIKGYNVASISPGSENVSIRFENPVTPRGTLIIVAEDVSWPTNQPDLDHECVKGRGMYSMSSSSITSMNLLRCSTSADCNAVNERAVSFMIYLIPD